MGESMGGHGIMPEGLGTRDKGESQSRSHFLGSIDYEPSFPHSPRASRAGEWRRVEKRIVMPSIYYSTGSRPVEQKDRARAGNELELD